MTVICVIGDLVGSRKVRDRSNLQTRLGATLAEINAAHAAHLASPGTITLGDEYQAVYRGADTLFQDFWTLLRRLHPARIRFSVGVGPLSTPINPVQAIGMDGPAFHVARAAMNEGFKHSRELFHIDHAEKEVPLWIPAGLALISHEVLSWKANRFDVFLSYLAGQPARDMAEAMSVSPTAIYKNIQAGAMEPIAGLTQAITHWLQEQIQS